MPQQTSPSESNTPTEQTSPLPLRADTDPKTLTEQTSLQASRENSDPGPVVGEAPTEHDEASIILDEFEKRTPPGKRVTKQKRLDLKGYFFHRGRALEKCSIVGTKEDQYSIVDRLSKLREWPMDRQNFLDRVIQKRIDVLLGKEPNVGESNEQGEEPEPAVQWGSRFPLLKLRKISHISPYQQDTGILEVQDAQIILETDCCGILWRERVFVKKGITSVEREAKSMLVTVSTSASETWELTFVNSEDALVLAAFFNTAWRLYGPDDFRWG